MTGLNSLCAFTKFVIFSASTGTEFSAGGFEETAATTLATVATEFSAGGF